MWIRFSKNPSQPRRVDWILTEAITLTVWWCAVSKIQTSTLQLKELKLAESLVL